jgi:hypothetical protein
MPGIDGHIHESWNSHSITKITVFWDVTLFTFPDQAGLKRMGRGFD